MSNEQSLVPFVAAPISEIREAAMVAYESRMFGLKSVEQGIVVMLLAQAKKIHYMLALERYHFFEGKPSMKADTMLAEFLDNEGRVEWIRLDAEAAVAKFSHPRGGEVTIDWTLEMAKQAGLLDKKGSVFLKYPRAMLRSRCISEGIRTVFPNAIIGIYTPEEVMFFDKPKEPVEQDKTDLARQDNTYRPQTEDEIKMFGKWKVVDGNYIRDEKGNFIREDDVVDLNGKDVFELKPESQGEKDNGS